MIQWRTWRKEGLGRKNWSGSHFVAGKMSAFKTSISLTSSLSMRFQTERTSDTFPVRWLCSSTASTLGTQSTTTNSLTQVRLVLISAEIWQLLVIYLPPHVALVRGCNRSHPDGVSLPGNEHERQHSQDPHREEGSSAGGEWEAAAWVWEWLSEDSRRAGGVC